MTKKQKKMCKRIAFCAAMLAVLRLCAGVLSRHGVLCCLLYFAAYVVISYDILRKAWCGIRNKRVLDENFLMAVASVGAFALAICTGSGDYTEGVAVMLLYQVGELFQSYAVGKSRASIAALMDIRPDYANVEQNGSLQRVDPVGVEPGSLIVVQPGEKVPLDGFVVEGRASLNTSALTGESLPRDVGPGDEVISGCISMTGVIRVKTSKPFGDSTVSRILELVENASSRKSPSENFISRFARIYTPVVCVGALTLATLVPAAQAVFTAVPVQWGVWVYRALTFLVISCPCALVISVPLSFFAGLGGAGRAGILIKGSNYMETLSRTGYVVFDKTGTLTQGTFEVTEVHPGRWNQEAFLEYAALAECASSHPIGKSIQKAYGKAPDRTRVTAIQEYGGYGVVAQIDGKTVAAGNGKLMQKLGVPFAECGSVGTVLHMAIEGAYVGYIVVSDEVKPNAGQTIAQLKKAGVRKTIMLTGDAAGVAQQVAAKLNIAQVRSELLPADKVAEVEKLLAEKAPGEALAFVGDGINDAPVLTRADVGIAMGALGADAAIEAADVVLMNDDPLQVVKAIRISQKCICIVRQNVIFVLAAKLICLACCAAGVAGMGLAVFADVGVMLLSVLNAVRALRVE